MENTMPPISVLMKPSSGMCNMHCDYCFYCDETEKRKQGSYGFMSEETLKNIICGTLPRAEGGISYAFQGGEPTLRGLDFFRKVIEYERIYNKHGIRIQNALQTNGTLLNEEWCDFLAENHFLVGISIDGIAETHDKYRHFRGKDDPAFEQVLKAADLMDRAGVEYNVLTVVNSATAANIARIYRSYQENGWHWQQYIACLDPLGEEKGKRPWALTPEIYGKFLIDLFDLWYADLPENRQPYIRQFENWVGILMGYPPEACDQRGICGIQYVCEADGSVYPCDFYMLDEYRLGNFNTDSIYTIDSKRLETGFLQESFKLSDECKACDYFAICRGGCFRNRDKTQNGQYRSYFCPAYKMFFKACLPKMLDIAKRFMDHE